MADLAELGPLLFPAWSFYAAPWLLGLAVTGAALFLRRPFHQALGMGIMTVPVWDTLWGILESFGPLLQGGFVLRPYTRHQLSGLYTYKFLADLGYLGVGFLLYAGGSSWRTFWSQTPHSLARALAKAGLPMGRWLGHRGEGASMFTGLLFFPVLLLVTYGTNVLLSGFEQLRQSDESSLFANMTPYHALTISLAAGFGEELVYRALLMTGLGVAWSALARVLGSRGRLALATFALLMAAVVSLGLVALAGSGEVPWVFLLVLAGAAVAIALLAWWLGPMAAAVTIQAVFFGFAHSGYGTWIHVLLPTLFGLVAGLVAYLFGLWAAIVLHVLVNVVAFGLEASVNSPWTIDALGLFLIANLLLTLGWGIALGVRWVRRLANEQGPPA